MIIANPKYNVVFKRMMENEKVAKFFIGTLLEQTIETIAVKPQEYTYEGDFEDMKLTTDLLHYSGTNPEEKKKIAIEQEAWRTVDALTGNLRDKVAEQNIALAEKNQVILEKDKALTESNQAIIALQKEMEELKKKISEEN